MISATAVCLSIASAASARAETVEWIGTGNWFTAANWKTIPDGDPILPDINDNVFIYRTGPVIDKPGAFSDNLVVAGPNGSFAITAGGILVTSTSASLGVGINTSGTATVTGDGATWDSIKALSLGSGGGVGHLVVSNGGKVNANDVVLGAGAAAADSTIPVSGRSSELHAYESLVIGAGAGTRGKVVVSDGGTVSSGNFFTLDSTIGGSNVFIGGSTTNAADATAPGFIKVNQIEFGGSGNSINFNHTDTTRTYVFAPILSGNGILNFINGATVLTADSSNFVGPTNVREKGTLIVKGSLAGSDVAVWGVLGGNGNVKSATINGGGKIEPGNSIGTLHIKNNFAMGAGSTYRVELSGTASDLIVVGGTANIQSSLFEVAHDTDTSSAPVLPGKTYTILTTQGGLTVASPSVAIADFPFVAFTLSTDAFNGYLTTSRSSERFADLASTPNQKAVANALDTAAATNPAWQQVVGATEAQARAAFISLSNASIHANAAGVLSEQSQYLRDAVTGRLRRDFDYGTPLAPAGSALSYAAEAPRNAYAAAGLPFYEAPPLAAAPTPAQVYAVWAQALGSQGSLKGDGNAAQTDHSLGGVISGIDVTFDGRWRVGLAGGYSQSSFSSTSIAASGSSESYHVALYGGGQVGAWGLRGGASFSWNDIVTTRQIAVVNVVETQRGVDALKTTQVFGEVGHTYGFKAGALEPFANIAYVRVDGGVNETGMAAMTGSATLDTTYTTLGLRGAAALTSALTARGTLGWRHALGDITPEAALAFQPGGAAFTLAGAPIARDALVAEAGLDLAVAANASLGVSWSGQFADQSRSNAVKGNFSWRF